MKDRWLSVLFCLSLWVVAQVAAAQSVVLTPLTGTGGFSGDVRIVKVALSPAPVADTTVTLVSSDPAVSVPASVTIPAGRTATTVRASLMGVDALTNVTVTGSAAGYTDGTVDLTVVPCRDDFTMTFSSTNLRSGQALQCTVTLPGLAGPGGRLMFVTTTDGARAPGAVSVPYNRRSVAFTVVAPNTDVDLNPTVTLENPSHIQHALAFFTSGARLSGASVSRTTVSAGNSFALLAQFNGRVGGDRVINVVSDNPAIVPVPATFTVPAGSSTGRLTITTNGANNDHDVTLYVSDATYGGSFSTMVTVKAAQMSGIFLSPQNVFGGLNSSGTVTLDGPAGAGGRYISLSGDLNTYMPSTVIVPEGRRSVSFVIRTTPVDSFDPAKILAFDGANTISGYLFIGPAAPLLLRAPVTSIHPADTVNVNLRLMGVAGPSGVDVGINVTDPSVTVPVSVHVPAGANNVTFPISMTTSTAASIVIISASANGRAASLILSTR